MPRLCRALKALFLLSALVAGLLIAHAAEVVPPSQRWKITSVKVCRDSRGNLYQHLDAMGHFPVYSFFIPRPVWTVNGIVVEAQPLYERGSLIGFRLLGAAKALNSGTKNTVKLSLPDQNASTAFRYDQNRPPPGECYDYF
jgi:hypothetical protein